MTAARDPVLIITGPTASGKGGLALELARRFGAEIISLDSMKVYREIDVATAKPPAEHRRLVRHHLLDCVDPSVEFSTGEFLRRLEETIDAVRARRRRVILCGGTALYLKAFLEGFSAGPPADWELRSTLLAEVDREGAGGLHQRLSDLDPAAAERIHPADVRRIVRALEVCLKTGRPASAARNWGSSPVGRPYSLRLFGLEWERERLYERIDARVRHMVAGGLFEEARRLAARQPPLSRSASQSIGYKEILEGTAVGLTESEITAIIQKKSRRFAKRQMTWFRKIAVEWIAAGDVAEPARWADEVIARLDGAGFDS